jgi:hypothetical protein
VITLQKDFTKKQKKLADELYEELLECSHNLEEFSTVSVYGLETRKDKFGDIETNIIFSINYGDPEENGKITICNNY